MSLGHSSDRTACKAIHECYFDSRCQGAQDVRHEQCGAIGVPVANPEDWKVQLGLGTTGILSVP